MDQRIIDLYDRFTHGLLPRRAFLARLAQLVGGTAAALALLPLLRNDYARAATVAGDDPRIDARRVSFPGPQGMIEGYLVRLSADRRVPGIVVVHENRGLNPHIEDVARRLAVAGYIALAPDLLSPLGGTPADDDGARDMIARLAPAVAVSELGAAVEFLKAETGAIGTVGAVGFCWGGGMVDRLALASPDLKAAVAYYGPEPALAEVKSVKAAVLLHYAGLDRRITDRGPAFVAALRQAGAPVVESYVYPGVNHAFNNDTGARYDKAAADLAWQRTLAFLRAHLG